MSQLRGRYNLVMPVVYTLPVDLYPTTAVLSGNDRDHVSLIAKNI